MEQIITLLIHIRYYLRWILLYHKFGRTGKPSNIARPMRLVNPRRIYIGKNVSILNLARMECIRKSHGKKYRGEIHIGDETTIEQCCHIIAADKLMIGRNVTISAFVYIADCGHDIKNPSADYMKQNLSVKKTQIGDGAFLGIGSCVMPGVSIGAHSIVGAKSVVTKDVDDYTIVAGVPARPIKKYNPETKQWEPVSSQK